MWMCSPVTGCVKDTLWAWSINPQGRGVPYRSSPTRGWRSLARCTRIWCLRPVSNSTSIYERVGRPRRLLRRLRRLAAGADAHLAAVVTVAGDGLVDELFVPVDLALGERQVVLFERVVDDHLVKGGLRLLVE